MSGVLAGLMSVGCVSDVHVGDYPPDGRVFDVDAGADAGGADRAPDGRPADAGDSAVPDVEAGDVAQPDR